MLAATTAAPIAVEGYMRLREFRDWADDRVRRLRFDTEWKHLPSMEREEKITSEINHTTQFINGREGRRILESGSDHELFTMIRSLPCFLREHLKGTKYDILKEDWPSVAYSRTGGEQLSSRILSVASGPERIGELYSGNGVFVAQDTLLTNWHVYHSRFGGSLSYSSMTTGSDRGLSPDEIYKRRGLDAVYVHFDSLDMPYGSANSPKICPLSPARHDSDVTGRFVQVACLDPDESSANDGTKLYPSIAIPVTKRVLEFLNRYQGSTGTFIKSVEHSFLYISPPGESRMRRSAAESGSRLLDDVRRVNPRESSRMQGTSGSPVMMEGELVGLNCSVGEISYEGVTLDLGFFLGPDALREAHKLGMRVTYPDQASGITQYGSGNFGGNVDSNFGFGQPYQDPEP